jgi:aminopeptidase
MRPMDISSYVRRFAEIAMTGLNLQSGQSLAIKAEPENEYAAAVVAEEAYRRGARFVDFWPDASRMSRARLDHSEEEHLSYVPGNRAQRIEEFIRDRWALLSIKSPTDLSTMDGVDARRSGIVARSVREVEAPLKTFLSNDESQWTVMALPAEGWAAEILGMNRGADALARMWETMVPILRLDTDDPAEYWKHHGQSLKQRAHALNQLEIRELRFTSDGTDVRIPLDARARWLGGGARTQSGIPFLPNIPTEEVFTAPFWPGVSGRVRVTRPVRVYGSRIHGAWFEFKDGHVVDAGADEGEQILAAFLDVDEGSRRMGEVALVDGSSPIARSGLVFETILLDENATCHFALGSAYPTSLVAGERMSESELTEHGANRSNQHVDFMIGNEGMNIAAVTASGDRVEVMREGRLTL